MEANEELKNNEHNEFEEIEEKDLKAVSGGCGTSTPEPEPDPLACPEGGLHNPSKTLVGGAMTLCTKCKLWIYQDGDSWKTK